MSYKIPEVIAARESLLSQMSGFENQTDILKSKEIKSLYDKIPLLPEGKRAEFGKEINSLKQELSELSQQTESKSLILEPIDVTAPFDANTGKNKPKLLSVKNGSKHPLMTEMDAMLDIFYRMGFEAVESRQIDDDYHMFGSLNFPESHPARDDFDTFTLNEKDSGGRQLIAPAHTSTMQNRVLRERVDRLERDEPIAVVVPGRVFRNEDLDARHEHTFYQLEGVYVYKSINAGHLIATLKSFMQEYYQQELEVRTQPFYFPFTEPSFEFAQSCPFCQKKGCNVCSYEGWIELLGCGMIHPNVLREAGIDPEIYTGFAWGVGFMRMVMIKYGVEDIRHFHSGKLDFLRQFS